MKLDLTEITSNVGKHHRYEVNEPGLEGEDPGVKCTAPIVGSMEFRNTGTHLVIRGELSTKAELDCSRCMGSVEIPVQLKLDDEFEIVDLQATLAGEEEEEEALLEEEPLLENGVFDLSEFIRQSILVSLPIKPLCDEACKGLCPTCGTNLNEGPCDCPVTIEASPFAALKELIQEEDQETEGA
jgi:uncharacterized protein